MNHFPICNLLCYKIQTCACPCQTFSGGESACKLYQIFVFSDETFFVTLLKKVLLRDNINLIETNFETKTGLLLISGEKARVIVVLK